MAGKYQRVSPKTKKKPVRAKKRGKTVPQPQAETAEPLNHEQLRLQNWLKTVHFKRSLFGLSETDVWKKIAKLDSLYAAALSAERARYDALLEAAKKEWKENTVGGGVPDAPKPPLERGGAHEVGGGVDNGLQSKKDYPSVTATPCQLP